MVRAEKMETELRREQIAQAAMDIVAIHGVRGLTNKRVAKVVGIVPSALYKHFKSKDQIIDAIVDLMNKGLLDLIENASKFGEDPLDCLRRIFFAHIILIVRSPAIPAIIFSEEVSFGKADRRTKFKEVGRLFFEEIMKLFQKSIDQKLIRRDLTAETMAFIYTGMTAQAGFFMEHKNDREGVFQHAEIAWKVFAEMLKKS